MSNTIKIIITISVILAVTLFLFEKFHASPDSRFLFSDNRANWVQADHEFNNRGKELTEQETIFVKTFQTEADVREVSIDLKVVGRAEFFLDGNLLYQTANAEGVWKQESNVNLPELAAGPHQISVRVYNDSGPMLVLIDADKVDIASDHSWAVLHMDGSQSPVVTIADPIRMPAELQGKSVSEYFVAALPVSIMIFVFFGLVAGSQKIALALSNPAKQDVYPRYFRFLCHSLWLMLAVNCLAIAPYFGFDYQGHMDYIGYVYVNASLPLADQGWQMFQTPLYYIVSAAVFKVAQLLTIPYTPAEVLRVIPLACGFAQIEIGYRIMRLVFPKQAILQIVGLALITFMPMHMYMSQQLGNEVFAAVFASATIYYVFKFIRDPHRLLTTKEQVIFSVILSAAILSKISALLLILPTLFCLVFLLAKTGVKPKEITLIGFKVFTFVLVLTGWYFIRNMLEFGQPFVNGWSTSRGITWWQEPGFRTFRDFTSFGHSLSYPVLASVYGLWDSLYSTMWFDGLISGLGIGSQPQWNYKYAMPVVWLSLVPSLAILTGMFKSFSCREQGLRSGLVFSVSCVSIYVLAIAYLYATLPIYSTAKASYMLGLLPCFGILGTHGFAHISKNSASRIMVFALFGCWAVYSYKGYFLMG